MNVMIADNYYWSIRHYCRSPKVQMQGAYHTKTFLFLAVIDPKVGHTMDVLSPFISVLCHSD